MELRMRNKIISRLFLGGIILAMILTLGLLYVNQKPAIAVTKYSEAIPGIQTMPIGFSRTVTTTGGLSIHTFQMPFKAEVLGVSAYARSLDTTSGNETYTLDVKENGVSILSAPIPLYQTTFGHGTVTDTTIDADHTVDVVLTVGGTSPSLTDLTTLLTIRRTN